MKNDSLNDKKPAKNPGGSGFFGYDPKGDGFCLEYAESLAEGDLRPILFEDYKKEEEDELF